MAESSGPFDGGTGQALVEADWELMVQELLDGVYGTPPSSTALAASATGTRQVAFAAGQALARGHWYRNTSTKTLTSGSNGAGSDRIDRGVLRLDRSANTVTIELITGTAGAGVPALTNTSTVTDRPLYRWTVQPGATSVTSLTDERQWLGRIPRPCVSGNLPSGANGQLATEVDTGRLLRHDGSGWRVVTEDTGLVAVTLASGWAADGASTVRRKDGVVYAKINVKRSGANLTQATINASGATVASIPAGFRPAAGTEPEWEPVISTASRTARLQVNDSGDVQIWHSSADWPTNAECHASLSWPV